MLQYFGSQSTQWPSFCNISGSISVCSIPIDYVFDDVKGGSSSCSFSFWLIKAFSQQKKKKKIVYSRCMLLCTLGWLHHMFL